MADDEADFVVLFGQRSAADIAAVIGASRAGVDRHVDHLSVVRTSGPPIPGRDFRRWSQRVNGGPQSTIVATRMVDLSEAPEPSEGQIRARLYELESAALENLKALREQQDYRGVNDGLRTAERIVTRVAEVAGILDRRSTTNVLSITASPDFIATIARVMSALRAFPEARNAVAGELALPDLEVVDVE